MEKTTGIKLPTPFPKTLEIERTDSHIPSAPATTAKLTQIQNPKGPSPLRLTLAPFRLIFGLEKTAEHAQFHEVARAPLLSQSIHPKKVFENEA